MTDQTLACIEQRLARVERQNRILVGLMCAMAVVTSIAATHAASNVVVADEVRAHRFHASRVIPDGAFTGPDLTPARRLLPNPRLYRPD